MKKFAILVMIFCCCLTLGSCKEETAVQQQSQPAAQPDMQKILEKPIVVLDTDFGQIEIELFPKQAPLTTSNFINKVLAKAYDGTTFHRLVPGFVIQGGDPLSKDDDPNNDGYGGDRLDIEPRKLSNLRGTVSMASSSRAVPIADQSDAQFFINLDDNKCVRLDAMGFVPFGKVIKGMEVVDIIAKQPRDARDRPLKNIVIKSATIKGAQ